MREIVRWLSVGAVASLLGTAALAKEAANLDANKLGLNGYDPVSYFKPGGPVLGVEKHRVEADGAIYQFATVENLQEFKKDSAKYIPMYGGWCAFAIAKKKSKVEVDPMSFVIQKGRLFLFYKGFLADTREKWLKDPNVLQERADKFWSELNLK
ncbi:MAG: YHS domain-containing (seleno)protein [Pseudobdellovibrionaceae bacterium]